MTTSNLTITVLVDETPSEVFNAISNVRGWWSEEIDGGTEKLNDEFFYRYKDVHRSRIRVIEAVPGKRIAWCVVDNDFSFTKDKKEWTGTRITFDITTKGSKTELTFTHVGLVPHHECYQVCKEAWGNFISNSLYNLIVTGKGEPNPKEGGFNSDLIAKWNLQEQ